MKRTEQQTTVIKQSVSIADVMSFYFPSVKVVKGRCACPIHHGEDMNFSFKGGYFNCFVCGAKGDVIELVRLCFGITFSEAIAKLVTDFQLPICIDKPYTPQEGEALQKKVNTWQREQERRREASARRQRHIDAVLDEFSKYDRILCSQNPRRMEEMTPEYAEALANIDRARYKLEHIYTIIEKEDT